MFIDSSVKSLKAVLLHNGNKFPSIPVGHSVLMKEEYENVKVLLDIINYICHNWELCGDFQLLAFLFAQQGVIQSIHAFSAYGIAKLIISIIQKTVATYKRISSWYTQCDSPTPSYERKDIVANTPPKAWAGKAAHKGFEIRQ